MSTVLEARVGCHAGAAETVLQMPALPVTTDDYFGGCLPYTGMTV
jgi:hypothetical protein